VLSINIKTAYKTGILHKINRNKAGKAKKNGRSGAAKGAEAATKDVGNDDVEEEEEEEEEEEKEEEEEEDFEWSSLPISIRASIHTVPLILLYCMLDYVVHLQYDFTSLYTPSYIALRVLPTFLYV
jgi:hypothetical protein